MTVVHAEREFQPHPVSRTKPPADRFWPKVEKTDDGCWLWTASCDTKGYGKFYDGERLVCAYRWSWIDANGPVPDGLELDHLCRERRCVNPAHLEPVTHAENRRRARKATCVNGHDYDEANTYISRGGRRSCRACNRNNGRALRARRASA